MYYLGIEIGGSKLQLGVGAGDGVLAGLWRGTVVPANGPDGIRRQIIEAVPIALQRAGVLRGQLHGVGIGFGGPVDDSNRTIIKSHQIDGWDHFPLADWIADVVGLPAVLGNDSDVAGLAEALHGAGKGLSPIFYFNVGSGIGGGLILDGKIYRGVGRGAAEFGHLRTWHYGQYVTLESIASGWGMERRAAEKGRRLTVPQIAEEARRGDAVAGPIFNDALAGLAEAICHVIALLCPRRMVMGGGVSLVGEEYLLEPLRRLVAQRVFRPFAGLTDIVPSALGEEVVVHGALALARQHLGSENKGGMP